MGFRIKIDTEEAIEYANELLTLADNYATLSKQFLSEMNELSEIWEGEDANVYMEQTLELTEDLKLMCNRFEILSSVIKRSVATYMKRIEENIAAIRSKLR